jgi:hypothetical protein
MADVFVDPKPQMSNRGKESKSAGGGLFQKCANNGLSYAKELAEMPDHSNEATRATESRLGAFLYDENDQNPALFNKGPYELENGAIY